MRDELMRGWSCRGRQVDAGKEVYGRNVLPRDHKADPQVELVYEKAELGRRRGTITDMGYRRGR